MQPSQWWTVLAQRLPLLGPSPRPISRASPFALLWASGHQASRGTKTTLTPPFVVSIVLLGLTTAVDLVWPF